MLRDRTVLAAGLRIFVREVRSPSAHATLVLHGGPGLDHTYLRPYFDGLRDLACSTSTSGGTGARARRPGVGLHDPRGGR
ncbi:MAG: hypothetical protein U0325_33360 [Polyangiales bacterium]